MRRCAVILLGLAAALAARPAAAANGDIGVVLLHGKGGEPGGYIAPLASGLQKKGFLVSTPAMPWSKDRIYDESFEDSLRDIDREVDALRRKGAKLVVVAGQSIGANVALGYGAARDHVDAIIALAPGHSPEGAAFGRRLAADVGRAQSLVASGKGKEKQTFGDINQGQSMRVTATPEVYLSWLDPDGPAVMPRSAAAFKAPTPLLVVVESKGQGSDYFFDKAPPHPKSKFIRLSADHFSVPAAAIEEVAAWLSALAAEPARATWRCGGSSTRAEPLTGRLAACRRQWAGA
jgi:hypothetical protein